MFCLIAYFQKLCTWFNLAGKNQITLKGWPSHEYCTNFPIPYKLSCKSDIVIKHRILLYSKSFQTCNKEVHMYF
jgi:hypothetical protein